MIHCCDADANRVAEISDTEIKMEASFLRPRGSHGDRPIPQGYTLLRDTDCASWQLSLAAQPIEVWHML